MGKKNNNKKSSNKTDQARAQRESRAGRVDHSPHSADERKARGMEPDANASDSGSKKDYFANLRKLGPAGAKSVMIRRISTRLFSMATKMASWNGLTIAIDGKDVDVIGSAKELIDEAQEIAKQAADLLAKVPSEWRPVRAARVGKTSAIAPGAKVCVREDKREEYEGVLEAEDLVDLTVEKVGKKNRVRCKTTSGTLLVFQRGHLTPVVDGDEDEQEETEESEDDAAEE